MGGWALAVVSATAFGSTGPAARSLINVGFSPVEVAWLRITGAALVLLALTVRHRQLLRRRPGLVVGYGLVAVAGVQVAYFAAISRLPIGIALLIEYLAPVLVVLWTWLVARQRIPAPAVVGVGLTVVGLALVVPAGRGPELDPLGLAFALMAAGCLAGYFLLSATGSGDNVPPIALIAQGLLVGAVVLTAVSRPWDLPWRLLVADSVGPPTWLLAVWMVLGGTVLAYLTGVAAVRRLAPVAGSAVASLEVVVAGALAWALLGEALTPLQILGGGVMLVGAIAAQAAAGLRR